SRFRRFERTRCGPWPPPSPPRYIRWRNSIWLNRRSCRVAVDLSPQGECARAIRVRRIHFSPARRPHPECAREARIGRSAREGGSISSVGEGKALPARKAPGAGTPRFLHPRLAALVCLPGFSERAEFDADAAKSGFIKRLGDSWQITECCRKLCRIIVPGGKHTRDAEADHLRKHIEDFAASQVDVEQNTVWVVLLDRIDNVADLRNEPNNLAAEATKHQFQVECDEALIFNNENSQSRQQHLRGHRRPDNVCVPFRRVHNRLLQGQRLASAPTGRCLKVDFHLRFCGSVKLAFRGQARPLFTGVLHRNKTGIDIAPGTKTFDWAIPAR